MGNWYLESHKNIKDFAKGNHNLAIVVLKPIQKFPLILEVIFCIHINSDYHYLVITVFPWFFMIIHNISAK